MKEKSEQGRKILLVEDDENLQALLLNTLKFNGYLAESASDGKEALSKIQNSNHNFKLIITDIIMPQMGGEELVERVLKLNPSMKIIFISGFAPERALKKKYENDSVSFLRKPFDQYKFIEMVQEFLGK